MSAMLAPNDRELLLDALRPDPGTILDAAVGTTFTLDLEALLLAPLAFALFETDGATPDPTVLLAAIQQHAERIALYCDASHIRTRAQEQRLFVLLESTVLAVNAPLGGSFHPKLWVLRFRTTDGEHQHRVLVMSRNLTFDTSWDLVARFDQEPAGAPLGTSVAGVVRALANVRPSALATSVADSVEKATFAVPPPFHSAHLHATGFAVPDGSAPRRDPPARLAQTHARLSTRRTGAPGRRGPHRMGHPARPARERARRPRRSRYR
jgi:hypothetical protein